MGTKELNPFFFTCKAEGKEYEHQKESQKVPHLKSVWQSVDFGKVILQNWNKCENALISGYYIFNFYILSWGKGKMSFLREPFNFLTMQTFYLLQMYGNTNKKNNKKHNPYPLSDEVAVN